ncbi:hypothetical protein LTR78_000070 [Recurvomyces mirabilis]|uniref:Uncharacterized protein n=1 Tax=Recurvomyces mirabilis TaxID=574656 RepID=A0AAE0WX84_9PEZI|nr:hypothetical protein LTR78_000070 [Recurvomyces mirabilis]KAK5161726.1 hypothetical protein LTS14_000071 [Recurvomyces mirabilis]
MREKRLSLSTLPRRKKARDQSTDAKHALSPQVIRHPLPAFKDEPTSPDYKYNQIARNMGLKQWPVKIFRRFSLRGQADPTYMAAEMVWPMIVRSREQWIRHPERQKVATTIRTLAPEGGWQVNNAFFLGLALNAFVPVEDRFNDKDGSAPHQIRQFVWFIDTVSLIAQASCKQIPSYVQENRTWTSLKRDVLCAYGVGLTHPPVAEELAGLGSFCFLPHLPMWVRHGLLARCPTLQPSIIWIDAPYKEAKDAKPAVRGSALDTLFESLTRNVAGCELDINALKNSSQSHNAPLAIQWATRPTAERVRLERLEREHWIDQERLRHLRDYQATHIEIEVAKYWSLIVRDPQKPLTTLERSVCWFCEHETYMEWPRRSGQKFKAGR